MKKLIRFLITGIVVVITIIPEARAESYLYNYNGQSVAAPDAYVISQIYTGNALGVGELNSPEDLFVDSNGNLYIADTGNNRILFFDSKFKHLRTIEEVTLDGQPTHLNQPKGVFATAGLVYICDTGNARVLAVNESGVVVRKMTREGLFGVNENIIFQPEKLAVDSDGNVFVVDRSIYQGIIQYDSKDSFLSFFSPNEVEVTPGVMLQKLWKNIFSSEQVDAMLDILPMPYSNLFIDSKNFLYTASADISNGQDLKRLNMLGKNIFKSADTTEYKYGDLEFSYDNLGKETVSKFVDVHVDKNGILCGADSVRGHIFLYDQDRSLITIFGGSGPYKNKFKNLTAIEKQGDDYLALDGDKNSLTIFTPTIYIKKVQEALDYYNQGLYKESVGLWENVLKDNSHFTTAYRSIGRAYLQAGDYKKAMSTLKEGRDTYFYSLAFKEYRKAVVRKYFVLIILGTSAVIWGLIFSIKKLRHWILDKKLATKGVGGHSD